MQNLMAVFTFSETETEAPFLVSEGKWSGIIVSTTSLE